MYFFTNLITTMQPKPDDAAILPPPVSILPTALRSPVTIWECNTFSSQAFNCSQYSLPQYLAKATSKEQRSQSAGSDPGWQVSWLQYLNPWAWDNFATQSQSNQSGRVNHRSLKSDIFVQAPPDDQLHFRLEQGEQQSATAHVKSTVPPFVPSYPPLSLPFPFCYSNLQPGNWLLMLPICPIFFSLERPRTSGEPEVSAGTLPLFKVSPFSLGTLPLFKVSPASSSHAVTLHNLSVSQKLASKS